MQKCLNIKKNIGEKSSCQCECGGFFQRLLSEAHSEYKAVYIIIINVLYFHFETLAKTQAVYLN